MLRKGEAASVGYKSMRGLAIATTTALATVVALLLAGSASAATVIVGSQLTATFSFGSLANETLANLTLPAPAQAASPTDGTVISWRFIGIGPGFTPRVVHPTGAGKYAGAGSGPSQAGAGFAIAGPFQLNLPIKKGDLFGYDGKSGSAGGSRTTPGASYVDFAPTLAEGGSGVSPTSTTNNIEQAVGATVRYCAVPDLNKMTLSAAMAALAAADCKLGTIHKPKKKKARKKAKVVKVQSAAAGSSISDTAPIDLTLGKKPKKKKK